MGGKAVSSVISIVLLLAVVEATQFSISIPGNSVGKSYVACCPNAAADACFAYCLEHSTHYFDLVKVCPRRCNCPFVEGSECNAVWGISEEEARKHYTKGSKIAMVSSRLSTKTLCPLNKFICNSMLLRAEGL